MKNTFVKSLVFAGSICLGTTLATTGHASDLAADFRDVVVVKKDGTCTTGDKGNLTPKQKHHIQKGHKVIHGKKGGGHGRRGRCGEDVHIVVNVNENTVDYLPTGYTGEQQRSGIGNYNRGSAFRMMAIDTNAPTAYTAVGTQTAGTITYKPAVGYEADTGKKLGTLDQMAGSADADKPIVITADPEKSSEQPVVSKLPGKDCLKKAKHKRGPKRKKK